MLETAPLTSLRTVLLLEDDERSIHDARDFFEGSGPSLLVARDAGEFERALEDHADSLEAIVFEVALGPLEVLSKVRDRLAHVPCAGVTDRAPDEAAIQALRLGVVEYARKPVDWPALWRLLHEHAEERRRERTARAFHSAMMEASRFLRHVEALSRPADHDALLRQCLNVCVLAAEANCGWLFLPQGDGLEAVQAVGAELPSLEECREGLFLEVFRSRRERVVGLSGDESSEGLAVFERGRSSLAAVPLLAEGRCLGVLEVARSAGHPPFRGHHGSLLAQFGRLAGELLRSTRREERLSGFMHRALRRVMAAQEGDPPHALARLARESVAVDLESGDPAERDIASLVATLHRLDGLGGHHLGFWRETLDHYAREFEARP